MIAKIVPIVIICAYMAVCLVIGYLVFGSERRRGTAWDSGEYFIGQRTIGPFLGAMTYISTVFSALVFLGAVGIYFALGIGFNVFLLSEMIIIAIFVPTAGYIFWRLAHKHDYVTPADLVAHRYGNSKAVRAIVGVNTIGFNLFYMAAQIVGISYIMETVTGGLFNYTWAVILISAVLAVYIVLGGFRAVVWTDALQVIILGICVVATFLILSFQFQWSEIFTQVQQVRPALFKAPGPVPVYTMRMWTSLLFVIGIGFVLLPQLWVRVYAVKSEQGLRRIVTYFIAWTGVLFFICFFLAIAAAPIIKTLFAEGEKIVPAKIVMKLMFNNMSPWLAATLLTGAVAATMSTVDSAVLAISSVLTRDLYSKQVSTAVPVEREAVIGRIISVLLIVLMAILAFFPPKLLFSSLIDFTYPGLVALAPATIIGLYWRKASTTAAIASIVGGSLMAVYVLFNKNPMGLYSGFWSLVVALVVYIVVTLIAPSKEETFLPDTISAG